MARKISARKISPPKTASASRDLPLKRFRGTLVLLGAGKMGGAMLDGWLARGLDPKRVTVIDPAPGKSIKALTRRGLKLNPKSNGKTRPVQATALVVAVKPQVAADTLPAVRPMIGRGTLVLSIMAGRTLGFLAEHAGTDAALVRAMPNTPAAIGRGITVAVPARGVSTIQRKLATDLLAATGAVEWVKDEALMDAVTAVSGSGPAYVFLLAETLARAGAAAGLPGPLAERLARATVAGSGELLHQSPLGADVLRQNVTSPGGTTAAALAVLMADPGMAALMVRAVDAATKRSRELAG